MVSTRIYLSLSLLILGIWIGTQSVSGSWRYRANRTQSKVPETPATSANSNEYLSESKVSQPPEIPPTSKPEVVQPPEAPATSANSSLVDSKPEPTQLPVDSNPEPTQLPVDSNPEPTQLPVDSNPEPTTSGPDRAKFPSVVYDNAPVLVGYNSFNPYEPENPRFGTCMFLYMALYAAEHNINFVFYVAPKDPPPAPANLAELPTGCRATEYCRHGKSFGGCHRRSCVGPKGCLLHPVWCKVKAVRAAHASFTTAPFIVWLDTDVFVRFEDFHRSAATVIPDILSKRGSPLAEKPFVANQERPSWWTNKVNGTRSHVTYRYVINSGVFIVGAGPGGAKVVETWWNSSLEDYGLDPLKHKWRTEWPWEQDRLLSLINEPRHGVYDDVQVLSDPGALIQANWMQAEKRPGTCLSCLPRWRCFFYHCSDSKEMKLFWGKRALYVATRLLNACATQSFPLEITLSRQAPEAHPPGFPVRLTFQSGNWCPSGGWLHQLLQNVENVADPVHPRDCDYLDSSRGAADWEKHYSMATKVVELLSDRHVVTLY